MICDSPFYVLPRAGTEKVPVPCGKCPPCKLRRVNGWVFRLLEEEKVSSSAHFVTITYDTNHVPISENGFMTLCKRDVQLYFKRLRKLCAEHIKYYIVGEYGSQNRRPHYHAIVFNVGDIKHFYDAWALGAVHVGKVSGDSIAYTLKYIDKPASSRHARDDRVKEFSLMSKGLGKSYLSDATISYHKADLSRVCLTRLGGHRISMPKYYKDKIYDENDKRVQMFQAQRAKDDQEIIDRRLYESFGYDPAVYPFEAWMESRRYGRYNSFYSHLKNRNL